MFPGEFFIALFAVAFLLNLAWEFAHARLYVTKVTNLFLVWQSVKDAFWITLAYALVSALEFGLGVFVLALFVFSYIVELHAIRTKRWEYAKEMPLFFDVGLSPQFELGVTGVAALYLVTLLGA